MGFDGIDNGRNEVKTGENGTCDGYGFGEFSRIRDGLRSGSLLGIECCVRGCINEEVLFFFFFF